jgi:molecular chaperone DnaJ
VPGDDIALTVEVSLEEAAQGVSRELEFDAYVRCRRCHGNGAEPGTRIGTCPTCGGTGQLQAVSRTAFGQLVRSRVCDHCGGDGRIAEQPCEECDGEGRALEPRVLSVDVPAGIADGQRIRFSGQGNTGPQGGPNGDLYVFVSVIPDPRFERHGDDLVTRKDIPFTDAALGSTLPVDTLYGEEELEIEPGTQPGAVLRLKGRGLPSLRGTRRGDLHVVLNVMVPRRLSDEQRDLLRRFAESANGENYPVGSESGGFFDRIRAAFRG